MQQYAAYCRPSRLAVATGDSLEPKEGCVYRVG